MSLVYNKDQQDLSTEVWNKVYKEFEPGKPLGIQYPNEQFVIFVANMAKSCDSIDDYFDDRGNEFTSKMHDGKALEIGFGTMANLKMVYERGYQCHGLEVSNEAVKRGNEYIEKNNIDGIKLDVWKPYKLPCEDNTYDLIYGLGCIYYNLNLEEVIEETYRALKPGGSFCFSFFSNKHDYMNYIEKVDDNIYRWADNHPNKRLIGANFRQPQTKEELITWYKKTFKDVKLFTTESDQTPLFESWWYITGRKS